MKKYLYCLFVLPFLWSCSNDEDKVASEIFNVRLGISVVDGEGNDLLDPNNEHHISLDDIQITYYNHYGDENEIARMEFYESDDDDDIGEINEKIKSSDYESIRGESFLKGYI